MDSWLNGVAAEPMGEAKSENISSYYHFIENNALLSRFPLWKCIKDRKIFYLGQNRAAIQDAICLEQQLLHDTLFLPLSPDFQHP